MATPSDYQPPALSAHQVSQRDQKRAMAIHHARTAIEMAVQACAGKDWPHEKVAELAEMFMDMLSEANDPTP